MDNNLKLTLRIIGWVVLIVVVLLVLNATTGAPDAMDIPVYAD